MKQAETAKRLHDAITACARIEEFVADADLGRYQENELLRSAVERKFEIVGEALSQAIRGDETLEDRIPHLQRILGMRNRISHGYDDVHDEIVWDAIQNHIPDLKRTLERELGEPSQR